MRCTKVKTLISAYIDDELNSSEHSAFEQHLSACQDCGRALAEIGKVHRLFVNVETYKAPPTLITRIRANIRESQTARASFSLFTYTVRVAEVFFVMAILITGVLFGNILMKDVMPRPPENTSAFLALDMFDPTPPDTIGGVYLAMTENNHEK
jgi:anti-sigma factor RsiW